MRISDWSSDVCSSDLLAGGRAVVGRRVIDPPFHVVIDLDVLLLDREEVLGLVVERQHAPVEGPHRSEEHTSELQSLMRISYAVFCLKKKNTRQNPTYDLQRYNDNNRRNERDD